MIESNNPEINVDELMVKIREEVARRRAQNPSPFSIPITTAGFCSDGNRVVPSLNANLQAAEYQAQHVGDTMSEWMRFGRREEKDRSAGRAPYSVFILNLSSTSKSSLTGRLSRFELLSMVSEV